MTDRLTTEDLAQQKSLAQPGNPDQTDRDLRDNQGAYDRDPVDGYAAHDGATRDDTTREDTAHGGMAYDHTTHDAGVHDDATRDDTTRDDTTRDTDAYGGTTYDDTAREDSTYADTAHEDSAHDATREEQAYDEPVHSQDAEDTPLHQDDEPVAQRKPSEQPVGDVALFATEQADDYKVEWRALQGEFVDDPREAVRRADELVAEVMQNLAATFAEHKRSLEQQWQEGERVETEELRLALQRYRSFFDRLLSL